MFLSSSADIVIYGGAAGGGKTFGILLESIRHIRNPNYGFVVFRRTTPQITNEGGLWDTSFEVYPRMNGIPKDYDHSWLFPSGATGRFTHLEHELTIYDWDGAQIPLLIFDQVEHFTEKQFSYMLTRNRTTCGVRPYCRATANPPRERDHWLRHLLSWWIGVDGFPIQERAGIIRYFTRVDGKIKWVGKDFKDHEGYGPKSLTFIPAKLSDNPILTRKSPDYGATLAAQDRATRLRLKDGNWNVFEDDGMFEREWFTNHIIEPSEVPKEMSLCRYWDCAATEVSAKNKNPDFIAGALGGMHDGVLYILDMRHEQLDPVGLEKLIADTAEIDGHRVEIEIEEEGGSSGKIAVSHFQRNVLSRFVVSGDRPTGDKKVRARGWCAKAERGHVKLVRGHWNHDFLDEVASFPNGKKDQVDAVSGLHKRFTEPMPGFF
jgi:predicted phage terminase large subunit-like protein